MEISRRVFCQISTSGLILSRSGSAQNQFGIQRCGAEWAYHSAKRYDDPFNKVELDVIFGTPIRYAPPLAGRYSYRTVCTDTANADLHERAGNFSVEPYSGENAR
jgi:hypothetical protein